MLNKPVDEILFEDGKVVGLRSGEETVRCGAIVCSPTYAPDNVRKTGQVIRAICILNHPIEKLPNCLSAQIIIPSYECGRKHDIYVSYLSHTHMVCPEGFFLVLLATTVETDKPHDELKPGIDLLGTVDQVFYSVDDLWAPVDDGRNAKLFVSTSYDASTHFESTFNDVLSLYERITGESFDLEKVQQAIAKVKESLPKDG
ncbi:unnamed protein product [Dicrocoelium dendriticum]|nr:unnamed protein product [Dicrocoelium dendriticum]